MKGERELVALVENREMGRVRRDRNGRLADLPPCNAGPRTRPANPMLDDRSSIGFLTQVPLPTCKGCIGTLVKDASVFESSQTEPRATSVFNSDCEREDSRTRAARKRKIHSL
jgi:hypothetical protein